MTDSTSEKLTFVPATAAAAALPAAVRQPLGIILLPLPARLGQHCAAVDAAAVPSCAASAGSSGNTEGFGAALSLPRMDA